MGVVAVWIILSASSNMKWIKSASSFHFVSKMAKSRTEFASEWFAIWLLGRSSDSIWVFCIYWCSLALFGMLRGDRSDDKNNRASHISQKHYYQTQSYSFDCDLHCSVSFRCTIGCAVGANIFLQQESLGPWMPFKLSKSCSNNKSVLCFWENSLLWGDFKIHNDYWCFW